MGTNSKSIIETSRLYRETKEEYFFERLLSCMSRRWTKNSELIAQASVSLLISNADYKILLTLIK